MVVSHILQVNGLCRNCCAKGKVTGADRHTWEAQCR
jgi:hypothetical protein